MAYRLFLLFFFVSCGAFAHQDPAQVKAVVDDYLRVQTQGLPGEVSYAIGPVDPANTLPPCPAFDVSLPQGGRLWGRGSVIVRCLSEPGWRLFVPVEVHVRSEYLVAARPLGRGQFITETDLAKQSGDLTELPSGILLQADQVIGRTVAMSIPAGRPIRADMLRQPLAVQQGQGVKVVSQGKGFQVTGEGRALNNAVAGQVAQVRLNSGQIVSGIARPGGIVEVGF
jgi:flagella basal body P-ring formation protein FlgA